MVSTFSRVWINRVWLPILLVVRAGKENYFVPFPGSRLGKCSRETGSTVPSRVSLLIFRTETESGAYSRNSSRFPRRRPFIYTVNCDRVTSECIGSRNCVPMAVTAESPPTQGSLVKVIRVRGASSSGNPMNQFLCAFSFSRL